MLKTFVKTKKNTLYVVIKFNQVYAASTTSLQEAMPSVVDTCPLFWAFSAFTLKRSKTTLILPNKHINMFSNDLHTILVNLLIRSLVYKPRYKHFFYKRKNNPLKHIVFKSRSTNNTKLCFFLLDVMFNSLKFLKLFRVGSDNFRVFFSANFSEIKDRKPTPHFSWRFTKLKNKLIIRKLSTSKLLYDLKFTQIKVLRKGLKKKFPHCFNSASYRISKSFIMLFISLGVLPHVRNKLLKSRAEIASGNLNTVSVVVLGARIAYRAFLDLIFYNFSVRTTPIPFLFSNTDIIFNFKKKNLS